MTRAELEAGLDGILQSPCDDGRVELIVRRPRIGDREELTSAELDVENGLCGDTWKQRASSRSADGGPHPDMQLNLMNARVIDLITGDRRRWHLAGDQLFVDLDLGSANLPPGTRLSIGSAVIEVTAQPHTGCGKFVERFGADAMSFVNDPARRHLNLRGINAKVVTSGTIRVGDAARKMPSPRE
jgi:hypothetical protein